jgi:hypothetical protein
MTTIPFLWRTSSASGVVGPFAASATILALIREALARVMTPSSAAGPGCPPELEQLLVRDGIPLHGGHRALLLFRREEARVESPFLS